jgi:hypothetical protein
LLDEYLLKNKLETKMMLNWTHDVPKGSKNDILHAIKYFHDNYPKYKKFLSDEKIKILEIGTYTGVSLIEYVHLINNSCGDGVDLWENNNFEKGIFQNMDSLQIEKTFHKNVLAVGLTDRIKGYKQKSTDYLINCLQTNKLYDFIYIDGSHLLLDAHIDITLAWKCLEKNGIFIIDDYYYNKDNILESPFEAVNYFLKKHENEYKLLNKSYRVIVEKI